MRTLFLLTLLLCLTALVAAPQSKPAGSGHWEGALHLPDRDLKIALDLAKNEKGEWIGDMDFAEMGAKDVPVSSASVQGTKVAFAINGIPGDPSFAGELSADGKAIKGELSQGGGNFGVEMKWVAEADVKVPAKSTPIAKEFLGAWEGALTTPMGAKLRVLITIKNGTSGAGEATLTSLDQGAQELAFNTITQKDASIRMELKAAGIVYEGELKGDEIAGKFMQGMANMPLTLTRAKK